MKSLLLLLLTGSLATTAFAQTLSVHEWGTFTTLSGSSGGTLSGLYLEEEQLPSFVYHHSGFSPDPILKTEGYRTCKNVTVKMETPVLYFYSPVERDVQVQVNFPHGTISQWYPERINGEPDPIGAIDLATEQTGSIEWNAKVLDPNTTASLTHNGGTREWTTPRETDANLVKNHIGEVEKFLFYRGLANFELPVDVKFNAGDGNPELSVTNLSSSEIPFIYIYDHTESGHVRIWGIGPLSAGTTKIFSEPTKYYSSWEENIDEYSHFADALKNAGLTHREASAMLRTWTSGYFQSTGFKVFWIVPREITDAILPIQITPAPDSLERVLVGKSEIMTLKLENQLLEEYKAGTFETNWKNHHYYVAYRQRIEQLLPATVSDNLLTNFDGIFPNPVEKTLSIRSSDSGSPMHVFIRNILGEIVIDKSINTSEIAQIDVSSLQVGIYFLHVLEHEKTKTFKIIKN
jgi:hypothetical protein